MITSIRIDDNKKTPFKYIPKIKAFKNGSEFIFKPGVNVIVGKNGSGKSTLLNMISKYMLCEKKMCYMAFATFIVDNMRKQNMLKEDKIAELLKDNPNGK